MTVLYDINVLMDFLEARDPFDGEAAIAWDIAEKKRGRAYVSALTVSTVYYLSRRHFDRATAELAVAKVVGVFNVAAVDSEVIRSAMASGMSDFEDAIQSFAGANANATHVVTRDAAGFKNGPLAFITPSEFLTAVGHQAEV